MQLFFNIVSLNHSILTIVLTKLTMFHIQESPSPTTLFIGDLSVTANEISIYHLFNTKNISINFLKIMKNKSNNSLGYAFVSLESVEQAQLAVNLFNGVYLCGRKLRVCFAKQFDDLRINRSNTANPNVNASNNTSNNTSNTSTSAKYIQNQHQKQHQYQYQPNMTQHSIQSGASTGSGSGSTTVMTNINTILTATTTTTSSEQHYDPRNSIYFKFLIPMDICHYITTDEGIVRSIFTQKFGVNSVIDVNIRRMAIDEVCVYVCGCMRLCVYMFVCMCVLYMYYIPPISNTYYIHYTLYTHSIHSIVW